MDKFKVFCVHCKDVDHVINLEIDGKFIIFRCNRCRDTQILERIFEGQQNEESTTKRTN
jgi:hypothetical protein